jgi:signal transduction histidine kinase
MKSPPCNVKKRVIVYVGKSLILFSAYFITARLGISVGAVSRFATLVWFPSGIAMATLLLFGYSLWPAILLGALIFNFINGAPLLVAIGIGIGNTLETLFGAFILNRYKFSYSLDHLRDVLLVVLIAMPVGAFISATIGVSSLTLGQVIALSSYAPTWEAWWIGDMISILILMPFFLTWSTWRCTKISTPRIAEMGSLTVFIIVVGLVAFLGLIQINQRDYALTYLAFPPLIWAALRFGPRGTITALVTLSGIAIVGTVRGAVSFSSGNLNQNLLLLQCFMGIIAITSMILAAVVAEQKTLERQKDEFIAMASHELKTPVTSLKGFTQFLQKRFVNTGDTESARFLWKMDSQLNKLISLIEDLLDVTRIENGRMQFSESYFPFDELVDEIIEEIHHAAEKQSIQRKGLTRTMVYADRDRIGQVISNLLSNAIKYSASSPIIIVDSVATNQYISFSVQDFGLGIAKEKQLYVFERFYRVSDTVEQSYPGLGIGLYVSREIIKRQGGNIWVTSEKGKGSTFGFTLPVK